jgi:hypothetical protein
VLGAASPSVSRKPFMRKRSPVAGHASSDGCLAVSLKRDASILSIREWQWCMGDELGCFHR